MRLTDVLTNISNAGFVIHEDVQRVKPKVIDFQIISSSNYKVVDPFAAFCAGNGETGSYETNPVLAELFSSNNLKTRIQQTEEIIKELEHGVGKRSSLEKALTDAFTIISLKLFKERSTWLDRNALTEITGFSFDINENHITLKEEIENYLKQNP